MKGFDRLAIQISFSMVLLFLTILVIGVGDAQPTFLEDDFTGQDGNSPDASKWDLRETDVDDTVRLKSNTMRTHVTNAGYAWATSKDAFTTNRFTLYLEFKINEREMRPMDVRLRTFNNGDHREWLSIQYDATSSKWQCQVMRSGTLRRVTSSSFTAQTGTWYYMEVEVWVNKFNVTIKELATGTKRWSLSNENVDPFKGDNKINIGVFSPTSGSSPECDWDNLRMKDVTPIPNKPPTWGLLPSLIATEDIPFVYNFTFNLSDIDDEKVNLSITSPSQFVIKTSGLEVTFQFPNGVTSASVPLILSDRHLQVVADVNFTVLPVNDPPEHSVKDEWHAVEDTPLVLNISLQVWDIDNESSELFLEVDDSYISVIGFEIIALFPEGILQHKTRIDLTDGQLVTLILLNFIVTPVDDPPELLELGNITAIEDLVTIFNVTPFLRDVDTAIEDIAVIVRNENCTVFDQEIHLLYTVGAVDDTVLVQISDGHTLISRILQVHVDPRNDPPIVHGVSPKLVTEDEPKVVDLGPYIEDEDTPLQELELETSDPAIVHIEGFNITLLYTVWVEEHNVNFLVSDGYARSAGFILVQVKAVNDPPKIIRVGSQTEPIVVEIDEGHDIYLDVLVEDEESDVFDYEVNSDWAGIIVFSNGTVRISANKGEVGNYVAWLKVTDSDGGIDSVDISIVVLNVNDPPSNPLVLKPDNHTIAEEGQNITFSVHVTDPDTEYGQMLNVTWLSNISGKMMELASTGPLEFLYNTLPIGSHRITVKVTDGEYTAESWQEIEIIEASEPPPSKPTDDGSFLTSSTGIASLVAIVILVLLGVAYLLLASKRGTEEETTEAQRAPGSETTDDVLVDEPVKDLASLGRELDALVTSPGETSALERKAWVREDVSEPSSEPQAGEPEGPPSAEVLAERQHATEVRDVMMILTQLPRGLPTSLWNLEMGDLARAIVNGEKRTAQDGTQLVDVKGRWYVDDRTNVGQFLREWTDQTEGSGLDGEDRQRKLAQLDQRLLEGKISEETYERLRNKYEDSPPE